MPDEDSRVIQVSNLSPTVTKEQMKTLFGFIGKIDDIQLYPEDLTDVLSRVCFIKFRDSEDIGVSLHLTNTVFVDRPLIVVPVPDGKIPDETAALGLLNNPSALDPSTMYSGLTQYPALPASTELSKVEEIRRTVYVSNIDAAVSGEALMQFFGQAGEVKYTRMAGEDGQVVRSAFVEYTDQVSVVKALGLNGQVFAGRAIRVAPSNNAIVKPVAPGLNATSREIEEAMRKVNEAQPLIAAAVDPDANGRRTRSKSRSSRHRSSRSHRRSRSRHRSRSRSHKRSSSRSYKDSRSRRHSRSHSRRKSRSPKRRKSRSKSRDRGDRKRHRTKSRSPRPSKSRKSRSTSRGKRRKSRSPSRTKTRESTKKSKSRSHSPPIPKLEKEAPSASEQEHGSKKRKTDPEESSSSRKESSRRRSRTPKKSPKKSRSKSRSPRSSSRKEKALSRDADRKGSDRDRERDKDRDSKRDRDSRREKEHTPEKKRESERDSRKERDRSRERNRSRERREGGGDAKSSRHRDRDQEHDAVEEKSRKVKRDYDEEEKTLVGGIVEEKVPKKPESEKEESDREERPPSSGRRAHGEGPGGAPADTNLTTMDMDVDSE